MCYPPFQNSFAFYVHLGKYDYSFATEYFLISYKILDREKKKRLRKNISEIFIDFHENMFTCIFFFFFFFFFF